MVSHGVNLPGVAVPEGLDFEVNEQVAAENPMVENEVEVVVFVADGEAPLPGLGNRSRCRAAYPGRFRDMRTLNSAWDVEDVREVH